MKYHVSLDPRMQVIVPNHWPHTVIGDGKTIEAQSAIRAINEVADETGVSATVLTAERTE